MRIFFSTIRKLIRRPATFVTFGLLVGLLGLILIAVGATAGQDTGPRAEAALLIITFPTAYTLILSFILELTAGEQPSGHEGTFFGPAGANR